MQQNWKVKRHRAVAAASGNEGFYIDLFDNSLNDPAAAFRPSSVSTVRVEHDSAGMLAVNLPPNSCRTLQFEFLGAHSSYNARRSSRTKVQTFIADGYEETKKEHLNDDKCVRETHVLLREVHLAIFNEQVPPQLHMGINDPFCLLRGHLATFLFLSLYFNQKKTRV